MSIRFPRFFPDLGRWTFWFILANDMCRLNGWRRLDIGLFKVPTHVPRGDDITYHIRQGIYFTINFWLPWDGLRFVAKFKRKEKPSQWSAADEDNRHA